MSPGTSFGRQVTLALEAIAVLGTLTAGMWLLVRADTGAGILGAAAAVAVAVAYAAAVSYRRGGW